MSGGLPTAHLNPLRPPWVEVRSEAQCEALAAILQKAFEESPTGDNRTLGRRNTALYYARSGSFNIAVAVAINDCRISDVNKQLVEHSAMLLG